MSGPEGHAIPLAAQQIFLKGRRAMAKYLLLFLIPACFHDLFRVDQGAPVGLCKVAQPGQGPGRYALTHGHSKIDGHATPLEFVEQNNHQPIVWLHPFRKRTRIDDPAAGKVYAGIERAIEIVIATLTRAMGTRVSGEDRDTLNGHFDPAITTGGARLAAPGFHEFRSAPRSGVAQDAG